ncbi:MAG: transposase [Acidimicrobiia bacterium]|nr:transposase [Acidimicrobiia bacterium]
MTALVDPMATGTTSHRPTPHRVEPGCDAGKKIKGRKTFGIVDTLGLLIAGTVVAANVSDNIGGIAVADRARTRSGRFAKVWCDGGFKRTFIEHCRSHHVGVEVVHKIHKLGFEPLPKRWIVERTWSWLMNSRRLQVDYERHPIVTEGFIWAAHSRYLLRRLIQPAPARSCLDNYRDNLLGRNYLREGVPPCLCRALIGT